MLASPPLTVADVNVGRDAIAQQQDRKGSGGRRGGGGDHIGDLTQLDVENGAYVLELGLGLD